MPTAAFGALRRSTSPDTVDAVITARGLCKSFGRSVALDGFDIDVPRGSVYALLGRNGAGKSTLIQILMGMLEPTSGSLSILGLDPNLDGVAVRQLTGYIPDRLPMYDWMTVAEMLRFVAGVYPNWTLGDEQELVAKFHIRRDQKVGSLSRGYRVLLSLVLAMAHRPEVVLLDECTSGMDAIARREFERSVIDALQAGRKTVLFAGHQIDEMERICDWVGVIKDGRMLVEMPLDRLKESVKMLRLGIGPDASLGAIPACTVIEQRRSGADAFVTVFTPEPGGWSPSLPAGIELREWIPQSLEDIFVALVGQEGSEQ